MAKLYTSVSASLHYEEDADLIKAINKYKAQGGNISDLIRNLLREYFFGPQVDKMDEKTHYKIIQLEAKLGEIRKEYEKKIAELERELKILKDAYEKRKQAEEEERKRKEAERLERERRSKLIDVKNRLYYLAKSFRSSDTKTLVFHQIKTVIKEAVEKYGFDEEELWNHCYNFAPTLKSWRETEIRRRYV